MGTYISRAISLTPEFARTYLRRQYQNHVCLPIWRESQTTPKTGHPWDVWAQQQQQLKKLGIINYYLDQFNHNRSLHTPRAMSQTALQLEPLERATLLPGLSPGYVWPCSHTTVVY